MANLQKAGNKEIFFKGEGGRVVGREKNEKEGGSKERGFQIEKI